MISICFPRFLKFKYFSDVNESKRLYSKRNKSAVAEPVVNVTSVDDSTDVCIVESVRHLESSPQDFDPTWFNIPCLVWIHLGPPLENFDATLFNCLKKRHGPVLGI